MISQPEPEDAAEPQMRVMESIEVPCTIVRVDGTRDVGTARVVRPAGAPVPADVSHSCGPDCGRCPR